MVSRRLSAGLAALLVFAGPAQAQPDWRPAGGDLFARAGPATTAQAGAPEAEGRETNALEDVARLPASLQPLQAEVDEAAGRRRLDPKLLHALILVESAYDARARSPAGAGGLTQLMPATARELGVEDRFDAAANLAGGADYLARQLLRFGDVRLALAAYNAGPERVARLGRIPDYPETQAYVTAVIDCFLALTAGRTVRTRSDCRRAGP